MAITPAEGPLFQGRALASVMPEYMEGAMRDTLREIEGAYQPHKLRDTYDIEEAQSIDGVMLQLTVEDGEIFESFVKGSRPHFPPWLDAGHPEGLPFPVALAISKRGTPPHREIEDIIERGEERIAEQALAGVDAWLEGLV